METETRSPRDVGEQESKSPSETLRRADVEALSEDEDVITVRAPIAKLLGNP